MIKVGLFRNEEFINILKVEGAYCIGRRWRIGARVGSDNNALALVVCVGSEREKHYLDF